MTKGTIFFKFVLIFSFSFFGFRVCLIARKRLNKERTIFFKNLILIFFVFIFWNWGVCGCWEYV